MSDQGRVSSRPHKWSRGCCEAPHFDTIHDGVPGRTPSPEERAPQWVVDGLRRTVERAAEGRTATEIEEPCLGFDSDGVPFGDCANCGLSRGVHPPASGRGTSWHLLHRWSKWSQPMEQPMRYLRGGKVVDGHEDIQRRTCVVCNAVQERTL